MSNAGRPVNWRELTGKPWIEQPKREEGMYAIIRHYFDSSRANRRIDSGLTLEQAQRHCSDPETSSSTCTTAAKLRYTARVGQWFDGYTQT